VTTITWQRAGQLEWFESEQYIADGVTGRIMTFRIAGGDPHHWLTMPLAMAAESALALAGQLGPHDTPDWIAGWLAPGTLNRAQLDERHTGVLQRHMPAILAAGGRPPVGLLADLAAIVTGYAQVAAREALSTPPRSHRAKD
jgi:hypothetical protein